MNPFGGFMQTVTGLVPGFGDHTGNVGKGLQGLSFVDDGMSSAEENTGSFLAWVRNSMNGAAEENGFNFQPSDLDPDLPALDQLQALLADAKDPFSQDRTTASALTDGGLDNGDVRLPQGIINAVMAHHQHGQVADMPPRGVRVDILETMVAKQDTPTAGQRASIAGKVPQIQTAAPDLPVHAGTVDDRPIKEDAPAVGQTAEAAGKAPQIQAVAAAVPAQAGKADAGPAKDNTLASGKVADRLIMTPSPEAVMNQHRPREGAENGDARFLFQSAVPAGDEGHAHTNRLIQERLPSGQGIAGKANDPTLPNPQPIAGQTKDSPSVITGLTGQGAAHPDDDTADFRGRNPHQAAQRIEPVEVKEEAWQNGQPSEFAKNAVAEQNKPHPAVQDPARAMAGDQPTTMAVKPAAGQATALTRPENTAVETFKTSVMDQIVDKAAMRSIHGRSEIQIRLKPEFLGNVQMNIAADKEQLVVRVMTDRPVVKEIIETHLHQLKTELQNQGLTIDKFEVMVNPDGNQQHGREPFAGMFKHHFSQNGRRQQPEQDPETLNQDGGNTPDVVQPKRDGVNYFA